MANLDTLLKEKKCFKLICGAGNENLEEVEKLVALYAAAGCHFFDLCASKDILDAAQRGLDFSISKEQQKNYFLCISTGIKNEPHLNKAKIIIKTCKECGKCIKACPQDAISKKFKIKEEKCIGCLRCLKVCKYDAIEIYSKCKPIDEILGSLFSINPLPFTCIELHASGEDEDDVQQRWNYLQSNFDGMLSLCIDRSKLGNERIIERIKNLIKNRKPYTTIIQADGAPMSGGEDDFKTTLQAVAMAEIIQNSGLPVYILLSGGTNSKSTELSELCGVNAHGVSIGSFARKIVKKYIGREDFLRNEEIFKQALEIAQELIKKTINDLA